MTCRPRTLLKAAWTLVALLAPIAVNAQPVKYQVVRLPEVPAPSGCVPTALNENGDVIGYCNAGQIGSFAVVWRGGAVQDLGLLAGGTFSHAWGINSFGQIVGDADTGNLDPKAVFHGAAGWRQTDGSGGSAQAAYGLTDSGVIIGNFTTQRHPGTEGWSPVFWTYDAAHDRYNRTGLPKPPGTLISGAFIFAANRVGIAVGEIASDLVGNQGGLWKNDASHTLVVLEKPAGFASGSAFGVSDDGRAVGSVSNVAGTHAVLWQNDAANTPVDLGVLAGDTDATAYGVNTAGRVVGVSTGPASASGRIERGFVYQSGQLVELSTLIDSAAGAWTINRAVGINNAGQIIAVGALDGVIFPVLLNPVASTCAAISVSMPTAAGTVGQPFTATAAASGGTGPYTFTVTSGALPAGVSLSSGGELAGTPTVAGDFTFTIDAADAAGCGGSIATTMRVSKGIAHVTWAAPAAIAYGTPLGAEQLNASADVAGSFAYSPAAGTVLGAGAAQTLSAIFTPDDAANYETATASVAIDVTALAQSITFGPLPGRTYGDAPFAVSAVGGASGNAVTFAAAGACTVAGGIVSVVGAGSCTVTASQAGNANYLSAADVAQTFSIAQAAQTIAFGALASKTYGDAPFAVAATGGASGNPVTFAAAGACTVAGGIVSVVGAGGCTVTASQAGNTNYLAATDVAQSFTIDKAAQTISFGALANKTYGDPPFTVSASGGASGNGVTFAAMGACSVAGSTVTITAAGTCTITASQAGNVNYLAAQDVPQSFTIAKGSSVITWNPPAPITYAAPLGAAQLNASAGVAGSFVYSPAAGTVLAAGDHVLSVTFTPSDTSINSSTAGVTLHVNQAVPLVVWSKPADITDGTPLGAAQLNATANVPGSFSYSPAAGTVLPVGAGQGLSVVFTPADTTNYTAATAGVSINVLAVQPPPVDNILAAIADQQNREGDRVEVQLQLAGFAARRVFDRADVRATNLPPGVELDDDTGLIKGKIRRGAAGVYAVTIKLRLKGVTYERSFVWTVMR